jgi:hypothetical protein
MVGRQSSRPALLILPADGHYVAEYGCCLAAWMHCVVPSTRRLLRPVRVENLVMCIAGCAGVSGRSYYAEGPVLDVTGRPH